MQASAIKNHPASLPHPTDGPKYVMNDDSTPRLRQSDKSYFACPGKPFASASFGDDPFPNCLSPAKASRRR
jgi:hypothetical protein